MRLAESVTAVASSALPWVSSEIPMTDAPWWAKLLASASGPVLVFLTTRAMRAAAAWFRARAKEHRDRGRILLADRDPGNDELAIRLLSSAAGEEAAAAALDGGASIAESLPALSNAAAARKGPER